MVDVEKLSSYSEVVEPKEDTSSINILDAIKGVTGLIKEAKGLQKEFSPREEPVNVMPVNVQQIPPVKPNPVEPVKVDPVEPVKPVQKVAEDNLVTTEIKPVNKESISNEDVEGYFNKVMQALDMGLMVYGKIPLDKFKEELINDKEKIILMIKNFM